MSSTPELTACDQEPIHIPGTIQPHGVLFVLSDPDLRITHASANAAPVLGISKAAVLGERLCDILGDAAVVPIAAALASGSLGTEPEYLGNYAAPGQTLSILGHRHAGRLIVEFEPSRESGPSFRNLHRTIRPVLTGLERSDTPARAGEIAAIQVRKITGFDRVMVYRFDANWNGNVVAEDRDPEVASYLNHWFPESDIPAQARELYRVNRLRLIPDAQYTPVPVQTLDESGGPVDLSFSALRSVSPIHLEYLRNMDVRASMSISILREGELWGLIACHHREPLAVPFETRTACDLIGQFLSEQVAIRERAAAYEQSLHLKSLQAQMLASMAREDNFIDGLINRPEVLLDFASAAGAAVLYEGKCTMIGDTPTEFEVRSIAAWLIEQGREEVFSTDRLSLIIPNGERYTERASGLLAISISKLFRSYVLWFRPEVIQTVIWAGDPKKPVEAISQRLHPRLSFQAWRERVRAQSLPFSPVELSSAAELRNSIIGVVLRKAEELGALTAELQRSNKELESFSYSVSHDLRAPFRHIVGYAELLKESESAQLAAQDRRFLDVIIESAYTAGDLVDHLLNYSRIGRMKISYDDIDTRALVAEVIRQAQIDVKGRNIEWQVADLPRCKGDLPLLRVVWQNLIGNAVKYTRGRDLARIEINFTETGEEQIFSVKDNGVGFDSRYVDKLFRVFQRLHRVEEFEGTGIGLANVRRIITRHEGRTWAEGLLGTGASFYFSLPKQVHADTL